MHIDLIAVDLDGTLVRSDGTISLRNIAALKSAGEAGIHVVIASGRIRGDAASFREVVGSKSPVIACNGAVVLNGSLENPLLSRTIPADLAAGVIERMHERGLFCHAYFGNSVVMEARSPAAVWYRNRREKLAAPYRFTLEFVQDLSERFAAGSALPDKVMVVDGDAERIAAVAACFPEDFGIEVTGSHHTNREFLVKGASKGSALVHAAEHLGVPLSRTMAVGDGENDLSMFSVAGYPVAMGNAHPELKRAASSVTGTNDEDGLAQAVERILAER